MRVAPTTMSSPPIAPLPTFEAKSADTPLWARLVATFFGVGRLKPGPGTWGSLATMLSWALIARFLPSTYVLPTNIILAALAVGLGIPAATRVARASRLKDPQFVVIDETA